MKYLVSILSIIFSLFLLEILTRTVIDNGLNYEIEMLKYANRLKIISKNKEIGIEHKKNISTSLMSVNVTLNSDGFRNNKKIDQNTKKILMLGDSMTFGWGAQKTFSDVLNEKFEDYQVINAGIGNTNTSMQIENFFKNFKDLYSYDLIILNFFINDFEKVKIVEPNLFEKYSFFYTFLSNTLNKIFIKFNLKEDWNRFYASSFKNDKFIKLSLEKIIRLKKYCEKNDIKFIIHNIPELRNLKDYKFQKETNIIKSFADKNNIVFLNSYEVLENHDEKDLWVTDRDHHANDFAHNIIGSYLISKISKMIN